MELRYCEVCGDVIGAEPSNPGSFGDRFVCAKCNEGVTTPPSPATPQSSLDADDLDLFSQSTAVIKRKSLDTNATNPKPKREEKSSRLRLVESSSVVRVPGKGAKAKVPQTPEPPAPVSSLPPASQSPASQGVTDASGDSPEDENRMPPGSTPGSAQPAKSAQKIMFRCLFCRTPISIRPVDRTSKLACPSCSQALYVTPTARLLKNNPSVAARKSGATQPANTPPPSHSDVIDPTVFEDDMPERYKEDWPTETSLMGEDDFDSFGSREKESRPGRRHSTHTMLIAGGLLVPLVIGTISWVSEAAAESHRAAAENQSEPGLLETLGSMTQKGLLRLFDGSTESENR